MDIRWFLHKKTSPALHPPSDDSRLTEDMTANINEVMAAFSYPDNIALTVREVYIPFCSREGALLFVEGAADIKKLEERVLGPLMAQTGMKPAPEQRILSELQKKVITASAGKKVRQLSEIIHDLLHGYTILVVQGESEALSLETPGFESRAVTEPEIENVLKGPKEAFIESAAANRSLIRKLLKDSQLMTEVITIGEKSNRDVYVLYIKDIADPVLVQKVKDKLSGVKSDLAQSLSILEQFIEERSYSLIPTALLTERPDRTCAFLREGHVVLLMDNSPMALIAPVTFWSLFQTSEDMHLRWAYGNFIRLVRLVAIFVALMTPSVYLAVSTYHEEMLPTDLLLAIAATRERVPFPAFVEVFLMELSFELVREAGIRIPKAIGPTVGIVGALILGQAAVEANIISPILVIIVAITGLSSFAVPEVSFNFAVRIMRFFMLVTANFMGVFGIAIVLTGMITYMASFKSFGVPFLSPLSPHYGSSKDMIARPPVWKQWVRPLNLHPLDRVRSRSKQRKGGHKR